MKRMRGPINGTALIKPHQPLWLVSCSLPDQLGQTGDRGGQDVQERQADKVFEAGLAQINRNHEERHRNQRVDQLEHPVFPAPSSPAEHRVFSKSLEIPLHNCVNLYHQLRKVAAYNFERCRFLWRLGKNESSAAASKLAASYAILNRIR